MPDRYYLDSKITPKEKRKLMAYYTCGECGEYLTEWVDSPEYKPYLACHRHNINKHEGIAKEYVPPSERNIIGRREIMNQENINTDRALVAKGVPLTGRLTAAQATTIMTTIWKGAPALEVYKAAMLCQDYGLHPLMRHVYLVKYDRYSGKGADRKKVGEDWVTVLGIGATRLMMSRMGSFSYLDDTPRIMSPAEQNKIFGKVDEANIVAITKLRTKAGLEAQGYGKYPKTGGYLMGEDKGNSRENMAFIRSERNAFGRLFPDADERLQGVEVMDETYMETPSGKVDVVTGEIKELPPAEEQQPPSDAVTMATEPSEAPPQEDTSIPEPEPSPEVQAKRKQGEDRKVTAGELSDLKAKLGELGKTMTWLGSFCNQTNKWKIHDMKELTIFQLRKIHEELQK